MHKLTTLFVLSTLSAAVLAEGPSTPTPVPTTAPFYTMSAEQQQALATQQTQAMQQAMEAQRQFFEQIAAEQTRLAQAQATAFQQAVEAQRKLASETPNAPFAVPQTAGFPFDLAEPPTMPSPFGSDDPMKDWPQPPTRADLANLSRDERHAKMQEFSKERRAAAQRYYQEMRQQMDVEYATAVRDLHRVM